MSEPSPARRAAVDLMESVLTHGRPLSENAALLEPLAPPDRAAAGRLANDVFRGLERADRVLQPFLAKRPAPQVMSILRLGTVELCHGGAAHGVINDCVELAARGKRTRSAKGLVNAVLRKVAKSGPKTWETLRAPRMPVWLRKPLIDAWGNGAVGAMERAHWAGAPLDLSARGDPLQVAQQTGGKLLPTGSVRLEKPGQVSALPGFDTGDWWVQDAAAALPARMLGAVQGLRVLDMCAAPGGKTMQLAAAGADVTALDLSEQRLARVRENLTRTGLSATILAADALEHQGQYDAILLDAPCSATGTLRRHPDLPYAHRGEKIGELIELQEAMLAHALGLLKPGGRLVYATCSLIPDEGECQIEEALRRHNGLSVIAADLPGIEPSWHSEEGGLRLRPDYWADLGGMDGFYMALLQKT